MARQRERILLYQARVRELGACLHQRTVAAVAEILPPAPGVVLPTSPASVHAAVSAAAADGAAADLGPGLEAIEHVRGPESPSTIAAETAEGVYL